MHRICALLMVLCLLLSAAQAEAALTLPECTSVEQVLSLLDVPQMDEEGAVQPLPLTQGRLRYISQGDEQDPLFCAAYWQGGEPGDELDLTLERDINRKPYTYYARTMCTRAVYSMILGYFGVDMTPGAMSAMMGRRDLNEPYDQVTEMIPGIVRGDTATHHFDEMWQKYQSDPAHYSPLYLYIRKPDGVNHALLVVAATGKPSEFIVVDPAYRTMDGVHTPVYVIALNKNRREIIHSTFYRDLSGSQVKWVYQWERAEE